jgi:hypothetical protein
MVGKLGEIDPRGASLKEPSSLNEPSSARGEFYVSFISVITQVFSYLAPVKLPCPEDFLPPILRD